MSHEPIQQIQQDALGDGISLLSTYLNTSITELNNGRDTSFPSASVLEMATARIRDLTGLNSESNVP